ncbi:hypothetical protein Bbelb_299580 [Branchiostoma belcheri]|nr:hypothetical protein Bbelb_299580 [Branchiostoma belcheri]
MDTPLANGYCLATVGSAWRWLMDTPLARPMDTASAVRSVPISEECTLKTGGTSAHLEDCTLEPPPEKCADFGGMYAQNRRNVRSPGGLYAQTAAVRSVPILEECTLKTGGTSAHLEECTLKPPPEKCADFGGMYAQNRRNVRSPGGLYAQTAAVRSVPISEECTLKTGGTSAHLEECTLKPPPEKCADFGGMYAQNRRNVRSPGGLYAQTAAVRSVPISEECTLKTGGTSAHLEECTLKPPPEKCADFGGMYAQNRRNVRSPGGVNVRSKPEERPLTWRSVPSNRRLKCADFGGMYAQNRRNVRSPGGLYAQTAAVRSVPILEECTLKTEGTSAHLEECTLKPPPNVRSKPEERPLTWRSVRSNCRREKCADFGGMYAQNRRNVRSPGGVYAQTAD